MFAATLLWLSSGPFCAQDPVKIDGMPALCHAAWKGDVELAKRVIARGDELEEDYQQQTPLMWAAKMGHPEVVELLLSAGAEVNAIRKDWTALRWAAASEEDRSLELLLAAGADPSPGADSWYGTLTHLAALVDAPRKIELLHRAGIPLDGWSEKLHATPLLVAAAMGNTQVASALLVAGASVASRGALGRTALHLAAERGNVALMLLLLAHGADREAVDDLGRTPVHLASETGQVEIIHRLRWYDDRPGPSASVTAPDRRGWTPLHVAAAHGQARALEMLALEDGELERVTSDGWTALHLAAYAGSPEVVSFLLSSGANPETTDRRGRRARDLLRCLLPEPRGTELGLSTPAMRTSLDPRELLTATGAECVAEIRVHAGYPGMEPLPEGLVLALWLDGQLLFADDLDKPGQDLHVARVPERDVHELVEFCAGLGLFELPDWNSVGMHASSQVIRLRNGDLQRSLQWDRSAFPDYSWYPDPLGETYRRVWRRVESSLEALIPAGAVPLSEIAPGGELRGKR